MHIVIIADSLDNQNAGIHFYTKNIINSLLKIDAKNRYSFIHSSENDFFRDMRHFVVKRKKLPGGESYRRLVEIPRLIEKLNPDIVLEPCHIGPFRIPRHIKRVVTIHDLTPILFPHFHTKRSVVIHKILLNRVFKNADLVLTPSENTKKDVLNHYQTNAEIVVANLGIDAVEKNVGYSKSPFASPYILYLGTIEPRKNLGVLIDAFNELKLKNQIPHKLVLAGDRGWKSSGVIKKARSEYILMTGYLNESEKARYYRHADIFVYPSIYEGFGLPPLEAMSYGVPVVSSNGGSLKEILGDKALLFDPGDKEKLKEHILNLINNPELKLEMTPRGAEYVKDFTWEKTARKTLEAFERIFKGKDLSGF